MSIQWVDQRAGSGWVKKSREGYYGIGDQVMDLPGTPYPAYHIEALWAKPERIGLGATIYDAEQVCERHCERASAPA